MQGTNELILNEATMMEAVQFWLDAQMIHHVPRVTSVKPKENSNFLTTFTISLSSDTVKE